MNAAASLFDQHTAVRSLGEGRYGAEIDPSWWIVRGPNGGYVAALLVQASKAAVDDASRGLRSLTVHYLRPPTTGPAEIETRVERRGRSLTTVTARLLQEGRVQALAVAAFSKARASEELHHARMPEVPPPEEIEAQSANPMIPMHAHYDERPVIGGGPWTETQGSEALSGGWIRLAEPRPLDDARIVAISDAWVPAVFSCRGVATNGVPTIDLTVHVRASLPDALRTPHDFVLVVFRTREIRDGFLEEDGEIWSREGVLLAQCRQLAVMS
ncbi:MAG: thioesterase [Deltaproteobacteria bacterium]|jgi:acyl-CoA thioesterase|nr:thioesterase [Deltaproteobacteria bacterium]